jgi:hypothetical protein
LIAGLMNASSGMISQSKIAAIVLFFDLTSGASYGRRREWLIVWFVV